MTQVLDQAAPFAPAENDLVTTVHEVLQDSAEPLTVAKIRAALPAKLRNAVGVDELAETLSRQTAAGVLWQYPKYRSQQDRYWDRPMKVHVAVLLRSALQEEPLAWTDLRRKLPKYALAQAEVVLQEQISRGLLYRLPRAGRLPDRFYVWPPHPRHYLREELRKVFERMKQFAEKNDLEKFGFTEHCRPGAIELLHEEEWGPAERMKEGG